MPLQETAKGLQCFKDIIGAGKSLVLSEPRQINNGFTYLLEVKGGMNRQWYFTVTKDQINDLPATKEYLSSANALARSLDKRFRNVDPNMFVTQSGRLVRIEIEWPAFPWMTANGLAAASGVWASIADPVSSSVAKCVVQMTHMQTMPGWGSNPYSRPAQIINTIRSQIDASTIAFTQMKMSCRKSFPQRNFKRAATLRSLRRLRNIWYTRFGS
jgi:hypothetical protein